MLNVLYAVIVLGVMGAVFGLVLAIASKIFAVEKDERLEPLTECLPGANCGGCGYAGCAAYAQAVIDGKAPLNACVAGGETVTARIAEIMGTDAGETTHTVAMVRCSGGCNAGKKFEGYVGIEDCVAALKVQGGTTQCAYACLGFGTCVKACKFDAIHIVDGRAEVDREKCTGCMACQRACPRGLIEEKPYDAVVYVPCFSKEKGVDTRKACSVGCIGCKLCEKACPSDAIHVLNNVAAVDYAKCTACGACVEKCPRKIIFFDGDFPGTVQTEETVVG